MSKHDCTTPIFRPSHDIDAELREYAKFCKATPNGTIHVKRWNPEKRSYDFGFVIVANGAPDPVVYVPGDPTHARRQAFDSITQLISAGWIGD